MREEKTHAARSPTSATFCTYTLTQRTYTQPAITHIHTRISSRTRDRSTALIHALAARSAERVPVARDTRAYVILGSARGEAAARGR